MRHQGLCLALSGFDIYPLRSLKAEVTYFWYHLFRLPLDLLDSDDLVIQFIQGQVSMYKDQCFATRVTTKSLWIIIP
jgi:hypothetical protein